jgi:hypothetical protein
LFNQEANQHKLSNKTMPKRSRIPASSGNLARLSGVVTMEIDTHMRVMPRPVSSPATPDLFSYVPSPPAPGARRIPAKAKPPVAELNSLSDARLARLLGELTIELQRRKALGTGRESRPELDQAIQDAACALESLVPRQAGRTRRSKRAHAVPPLQEPKRKAIRAALAAGVAPGQVAKHFGLPLAAVRKVLTGAE